MCWLVVGGWGRLCSRLEMSFLFLLPVGGQIVVVVPPGDACLRLRGGGLRYRDQVRGDSIPEEVVGSGQVVEESAMVQVFAVVAAVEFQQEPHPYPQQKEKN